MKKYIKNLGISASIITTINTNIAKGTGEVTIVLDCVEYKSNFKFDKNSISEDKIYSKLYNKYKEFTNNGKKIEQDALRHILITNIESDDYSYDNKENVYTFKEDQSLKIYLKSIDYIKIEYTGEKHLNHENEDRLLDNVINNKTIKEIFKEISDCFKDNNCGTSNINGENKDSKTKFKDIDKGKVTIKIDSNQIADNSFATCVFKPAENVKIINKDALEKLKDISLNFNTYQQNINAVKAKFDYYKIDGKKIITGPFKIKIDGVGNEIESTAGETDLKSAKFIHLIVDKNTFNPCFLKKELKFDIVGGKDNYIISDETINKIQEYLNTLTNAQEVTEELIFAELKKLEKDAFVDGGIIEKNIECYKGDSTVSTKKDFGTDITVKIDPKAISPDKIKIKLTLGAITNSENINLDSAVVNAINDKIKEVKFGISVNEILDILNDNALKNYFTEALVDADILDNTGNALTNNVSKNSTIKIKSDKIKSEYFKKVQKEHKDKNNDEINQNGTQNEGQNSTQNGDEKEKKGGYCWSNK